MSNTPVTVTPPNRSDLVLLGVGLLAFIATFLPFDGISFAGFSANENAWHGIAGVLGAICITVALVIAVAGIFAGERLSTMPVSWTYAVVGLAGLGLVLFIVHALALPSGGFGTFRIGLSVQWGGYIAMILAAALAGLTFTRVSAQPAATQTVAAE